MGPREAVTVCLQDYTRFRGRARRPEYWWWTGAVVPTQVALDWADGGIWGADRLLGFGGLFFWLTLLPGLAVQWRRLQDTGIPGWFSLVPVGLLLLQSALGHLHALPGVTVATTLAIGVVSALAAVSAVLIFVGCLLPSQPGRNIFGPEPPRRAIRWDLG